VQNEERISRAVREKWQVRYEGNTMRITADFSAETLKAAGCWWLTPIILATQEAEIRRIAV
jgi:hypothetical protein